MTRCGSIAERGAAHAFLGRSRWGAIAIMCAVVWLCAPGAVGRASERQEGPGDRSRHFGQRPLAWDRLSLAHKLGLTHFEFHGNSDHARQHLKAYAGSLVTAMAGVRQLEHDPQLRGALGTAVHDFRSVLDDAGAHEATQLLRGFREVCRQGELRWAVPPDRRVAVRPLSLSEFWPRGNNFTHHFLPVSFLTHSFAPWTVRWIHDAAENRDLYLFLTREVTARYRKVEWKDREKWPAEALHRAYRGFLNFVDQNDYELLGARGVHHALGMIPD